MTEETVNKENDPAKELADDVLHVFAAEKKYLGIDENADVKGLAISGGGIRSASFGLGVMQALVGNNQLEKMDYMSTVSGGGYLGSALTWALYKDPGAGTNSSNFPLGIRGMFARKSAAQGKAHAKADNSLLDFIRQHSSYLMPTGKLGVFSFAGIVLRSMMLSLAVYFGILLLIMVLCRQLNLFHIKLLGYIIPGSQMEGVFFPALIFLLGLFIVKSFFYSVKTYANVESGILREYTFFIKNQEMVGWLWKMILVCLLIGLIPVISYHGWEEATRLWTASGATVFGVLTGIWQYVKAQKNETSSGPLPGILIYLAVFALLYGLLIFAFILSEKFFSSDNDERSALVHPVLLLITFIATFVFGYFVNLNLIGPHRLWRDRLMEAFMPDDDAVTHNVWQPAGKADAALMAHMCGLRPDVKNDNKRPYHIVNTNLILTNSEKVKFRGRGGDNFIISPLYCGSEATHWKKTDKFQTKGTQRGITLATAMATSAAALNPNAGVSGEGYTRNKFVSVLLSMLNLRLGYWTGNPKKDNVLSPPNFFVPGITSELFRKGLTEDNSRIMLSDGGHFENLGIYELIRRKAKVIIVSDGGADPGFNFDDLANAVEKVRVDFGAKIAFYTKDEKNQREDCGLNGILFDASTSNNYQKKYEIASRGYAAATITYNDKSTGTLIYLKLAMINDLSTDVYSYKGVNPSFPHQSTADQFFDEKQFEAYRELGYNVAWKMMLSPEGREVFGVPVPA